MIGSWGVVLLSIGAAFIFAVSTTLKHTSAGAVPDAQSLHPSKLVRFVRATISHPLWLGAIGCDAIGLVLQLAALHLGALAVVQPLLVSGLLFALLLRQRFENYRLGRNQLGWAVLLTITLATFVLVAAAKPAPARSGVDHLPAAIAGSVGALLALVCILLGRRMRGSGQAAAMLGVAVGVLYAASAALLKAITDIAAQAPLRILWSWQLYAVIAVGVAGLLLNQLAFQAGPLSASLPATATVDPLLSIVVGITIYDEHIRRGVGAGVTLAILLVLMGVAVIQLSRVQAQAHTKAQTDNQTETQAETQAEAQAETQTQ